MNSSTKNVDSATGAVAASTEQGAASCACGPNCKCGSNCQCQPGATCTPACTCAI